MAAKQQDLPHYGVKNGFTRKGKIVCTQPEKKGADGKVIPSRFREFDSISRAKRYMRTGN